MMFALILSVCMAPVNASGQVIGQEICEESHISTHKTMLQCISSMDRNIEATKRSVFNSFDWMYSCEKEAKTGKEQAIAYLEDMNKRLKDETFKIA